MALAAPPPPWEALLQLRLEAAEHAMKELRAVCEQPEAQAVLQVRRGGAHWARHAAAVEHAPCTRALQACTTPPEMRARAAVAVAHAALPLTRLQASDHGYLSAAVLRQLESTALLKRFDAVIIDGGAARRALVSRPHAATGVGPRQHNALRFSSLPHAVALQIFAAIPPAARARAALVSRAWRDGIAEPSVWTRLDLSRARGGAVTDAALRGAVARARGQLTVLAVECAEGAEVSQNALMEVLTAHVGSLRELHLCADDEGSRIFSVAYVERLVRAAPQLRVFRADVQATLAGAARLLRKEAPFEALQLNFVEIEEDGILNDDAAVLALAAALAQHTTLRDLSVIGVSLQTPAVMDAVAAAVVQNGVPFLTIERCGLVPTSVPALVRLMRSRTLKTLSLDNSDGQVFTAPEALQLADAIAAHRTLRRLNFFGVQFWRDPVAAAAMMRAATGHPSLRSLSVSSNDPPDPVAAGAALGALVAANTPALSELHLRGSELGDAGMLPMLMALPQNKYLQLLRCFDTGMSEAFARDVFLPAVGANTSLLILEASEGWGGEGGGAPPPEVLAAEEFVAARIRRRLA